jgi:hypothetical protein
MERNFTECLDFRLEREIYAVTGVWLSCSACTFVLLKLPTLELHCRGHGVVAGCDFRLCGGALINLTLAGAAMSDGRLDPP